MDDATEGGNPRLTRVSADCSAMDNNHNLAAAAGRRARNKAPRKRTAARTPPIVNTNFRPGQFGFMLHPYRLEQSSAMPVNGGDLPGAVPEFSDSRSRNGRSAR
jgi:hypothetical protein